MLFAFVLLKLEQLLVMVCMQLQVQHELFETFLNTCPGSRYSIPHGKMNIKKKRIDINHLALFALKKHLTSKFIYDKIKLKNYFSLFYRKCLLFVD